MVMISVSDVVSLEKRGTYQGVIGVVVAISNSIGPLIGGVFTEKVSWRWCFVSPFLRLIAYWYVLISSGASVVYQYPSDCCIDACCDFRSSIKASQGQPQAQIQAD